MSYREFLNKLLIGGGSGSGGASSWDEISGKPSTFPPSAHTHAQADVTGLTNIAAKAHEHANKSTLDKFGENDDGKPTYDGAEIGGSGGSLDGIDADDIMLKSVFTGNGNAVTVNYAEMAYQIGRYTENMIQNLFDDQHVHNNTSTLDKLAETDGKLTFDGSEIGGSSGGSGGDITEIVVPDVNANGYDSGFFKLPGGTIVQWGKTTLDQYDGANTEITFPLAFPYRVVTVTASAMYLQTSAGPPGYVSFGEVKDGNSGITASIWLTAATGGAVSDIPVNWIAIGY